MSTLKATIGLLTFNNADTLERCLESVKEFTDIVIADGGSTDETLTIAKRYGARIISQSNPGTPIRDFAKERNILLSSAQEKWFFYLDSDETVSNALLEDIRTVVQSNHDKYDAYRVRYLKTNADGTKIYRTFKEYYQVRLIRTDIGASFERPIHEKIKLPDTAHVGQLEGVWYVPLEKEDLSFRAFTKKAWKRIGIAAQEWRPKGLLDVLYRTVFGPVVHALKSLTKVVLVPVMWGREGIPTKYELLRAWYAVMYSIQHVRRVTCLLFKKHES